MRPVQDNLIQYNSEIANVASAWQPISLEAAMPYLKAIALATTLLGVWAGLCSI